MPWHPEPLRARAATSAGSVAGAAGLQGSPLSLQPGQPMGAGTPRAPLPLCTHWVGGARLAVECWGVTPEPSRTLCTPPCPRQLPAPLDTAPGTRFPAAPCCTVMDGVRSPAPPVPARLGVPGCAGPSPRHPCRMGSTLSSAAMCFSWHRWCRCWTTGTCWDAAGPLMPPRPCHEQEGGVGTESLF